MTNIFETEYFTINEASSWASSFFGKKITPANITYLINYGKIKKINQDNKILLLRNELEDYYNSINKKENNWKQKLGNDLNWALSFDNDYNIFLVVNDNYNLYPEIARLSNMKIIEQFKRPVLNRIEGKEAYCEVVFRLKNFIN
jgi:hypothetical protein